MGRKPVAERLTWMQPLPLVPPGSIAVAEGVAFLEDDAGTGTVFVWGQACFTWDATDPGARRLAAVQLVTTGAASQRQVARAFSVNETTLWRWRSDYSEGGLSGLLPEPLGPKRVSGLCDNANQNLLVEWVVAEILTLSTAFSDKLSEGLMLVVLPTGIVEIFIEQDYCTGYESVLSEIENGLGRAVKISIHMHEGKGVPMFGQEGWQCFGEPSNV